MAVGLFVLILLLRYSALDQPAVWDGSFGVFPAAETLVTNGFDYGNLLSQPGYQAAGPNVHSLSVVTLLTALVMLVVDGTAVFVTLHVLHFALAALAGAGVYRVGRHALPDRLAIAAAVAGIAAPVVMTQAGDIYLETPVLAATAWAADAMLRRRPAAAAVWASAAVLVKESGIIVALGLALFALVADGGARRRDALTVATAPSLLALLAMLVLQTGEGGFAFSLSGIVQTTGPSVRLTLNMPDMVALLALFLLLRPAVVDRPLVGDAERTEAAIRLEVLVRTLLLSFVVVHVVAGGFGFATLPRYWVQVVPFTVIGTTLVVRRLLTERTALIALAATTAVFVVNLNGTLYPSDGQNNFASLERSGEYAQLLDVHLATAAAITELPDDVPLFYGRAHHYWMTYPRSGYVDAPVVHGINVDATPRYADGDLADYPDDFYAVFDRGVPGSKALYDMLVAADLSPHHDAEVVTEITSGIHRALVFHVRSTG